MSQHDSVMKGAHSDSNSDAANVHVCAQTGITPQLQEEDQVDLHYVYTCLLLSCRVVLCSDQVPIF